MKRESFAKHLPHNPGNLPATSKYPKVKHAKTYLLIGIVTATVLFMIYQVFSSEKHGAIHIAFAGPVSGEGRFMTRAIRLYFDTINKNGGINGKKVFLDEFDDQNDPDKAKQNALEMAAEENRILAVIGHWYSSCSLSGGKIYNKHGIPAVTPGSIIPEVTRDNDWYFRTIYNANAPGLFLANYIRNILRYDTVSIIHEDGNYSRLARIFEKTARKVGIDVKYSWEFKAEDPDLHQSLQVIVNELRTKEDAGVIVMPVQAPEGVELVKLLKNAGIRNPKIGPSSFSEETFLDGFRDLPEERMNPGHYTNGIYVVTPLIFDTANKEAYDLRQAYEARYREKPGWSVAFAYDAAKVILEAIKHAGIRGKQETLKDDRRKIRDYLASLTRVENAVEGATGLNYFDEHGDAQKPISIGVYRNKNIISALAQMQPVRYPNQIPNLEEAIEKKLVLRVDDRYMYKTNVVYVGVEVSRISELDLENLSCMLDFYIWFRYQGGIDAQNIEFLNAAEPVQLMKAPREKEADDKDTAKSGKAVTIINEEKAGAITFHLYHVRARFKSDFNRGQYDFEEYHTLGFRFRHRDLTRNNLIYVTDIPGMEDGPSFTERMKKNAVLGPEYRQTIDDAGFFQDITEKSTRGEPKYLNIRDKFVECSQFNFWIRIKKETFRSYLRRKIPDKFTVYLAMFSCAMIVLLVFTPADKSFLKSVWFFQTIFAFLLLLSAETALLKALPGRTDIRYLKLIILTFDVLWWLIPALFMHLALDPFIWLPMQKRTCRPVPNVLRRFSACIIYFLTLYGITVYAFDQNINKLMATSGMVAMVVGFIVKSNISDFFSGIVINQGDAVRIGDWVKIGSFEEGKVVDITWRSTNLETRDGSFLTIPNSHVLDTSVHNYNYPNNHYRSELTVEIDPLHQHERVEKILLDAAFSVNDVLRYPEPVTRFNGQGDESAIYTVEFSVKDYANKGNYITAVWKRVRTHLEYAGIRFAKIPGNKGIIPGKKNADPLTLLQRTDIFQPCSDGAKSSLARQMRSHCVLPGETVIQEGDGDDSLFIIAEGVVGVWVKLEDGKPAEIARIGPGDVVGEMALLTGEPRMASLVSVTETCLFEITKADIAPFMKEHPEMAEHLHNILTRRKMETESKRNAYQSRDTGKEIVYSLSLHKIRSFFELKKS